MVAIVSINLPTLIAVNMLQMSSNDARTIVFERFRTYLATKGITIKSYEFAGTPILGNCSGIYRLKYIYDENKKPYEKHVLLKIPEAGYLYEHLRCQNIYYNEMITYNVILPEMYKFWNGAKLTPESYQEPGSLDLVLEDLTASGYRVLDKMQQLDLPHSLIVMQTLAKFHALSIKLDETSPQTLNLLRTDYDLNPGSMLREYTESLYDRFIATTEQLPLSENVKRKLSDFKANRLWDVVASTLPPHDGFNVLSHPDLWTSNILFKYNNQGDVEDAKIIDFQVLHRGSPAPDFIIFFTTSVRFEVYEQNRDTLLETYLKTLNKTLSDLKCRTSYSRQCLEADLKKFQPYIVSLIGTHLPTVLRNENVSADYENQKNLPFDSQVYRDVVIKWINYTVRENIL